ncbi:MAG TPA: DUF4965 domain-containing protein [Bryobacteraceae bacterium]|nr:DUF4965 domain-containing protein [Bryobacteraceae bacterium]
MRTLLLAAAWALPLAAAAQDFRPPAVPLVACDPYFSVWSAADRLTDDVTRHWTGTEQPLTSLVRIDGRAYRIMGNSPRELAAMGQQQVEVLPTRTIYTFEWEGVRVTLTFLTPTLPAKLDALARPVTYLTWEAHSIDGRSHAVSIYFDATAPLVVNTTDQDVVWSRYRLPGLHVLKMGSREQPVLQKFGDNLRIDWGYLYLAAPEGPMALAPHADAVAAFAGQGTLPDADDLEMPRPARRAMPALTLAMDLGQVGSAPVSRHAILAYDDQFSIEYLERRLRPYWRRTGAGAEDLLRDAERDYAALSGESQALDRDLMADLARVGGEKYARLAALAYRQSFAAHKLAADADGTPFFFPKENFSNGCIGTVDVIYPSSPLFLLLNPELLKASLTPLLEYAGLPRWRFPFAPHDLGTYPLANGQVYGGGEKSERNQMPVEESGNMLLMVAGIAQAEGNARYAERYWPVLTRWAEYLKDKGLDPENQLCTDDFAGHLAHNANLSLKAILALGAYGKLCRMNGKAAEAASYESTAREFARRWVEMAADGDHYRLAFDKPGTWSQKYNLVWDRLLSLNLFPPEVARREIAFYKTKLNAYGLPLDNRAEYTKLDWVLWTATLAGSRADFEALVDPSYRFANESPSRVPLSDWYWTQNAKQRGFQARSVVGGLWIKLLADPPSWKKWVARSQAR